MIKIHKGNLCNNCIKDRWQNSDIDFHEIYVGTEQNGLRLHLCTACAKEFIAEFTIALAAGGKKDAN